jgi:hypothetical protein
MARDTYVSLDVGFFRRDQKVLGCARSFRRKLLCDSRRESHPFFNNSEICSRIVIPEIGMFFDFEFILFRFNKAGKLLVGGNCKIA